ncbi:MAG TPA: prephenate dehydrogenase [Chloroflexi bacterium]|jgi:prephenate dehydrogenase|nr:prephenate dehydrogenase [Chloroflexota bacterium]
MESDFREARVTVVGLGLMGGSLAAALSSANACRQVVGVARRASTVATARALRFIHWGTTDLREGIQDADMVVLATPVGDILQRIAEIGPMLKPGCVLIDVGSTKGAICRAMEALPAHVQPLGGHPMCGKESSGLTMAEPSLYRDRVFVLCPLERTSSKAMRMAESLVDAVGARALVLDPDRHDRLVATISHLPYALAVTLVAAAEALSEDDPLAWRLAAGGFRDTSRVAAGSVTMMMDIFATNREAILETLHQARDQLDRLTTLLESDDEASLRAYLEAARNRRMEVTG